ncbi:MAG: hypothetical protein ACRYG7_34175 [Janthinobacterium lividum]
MDMTTPVRAGLPAAPGLGCAKVPSEAALCLTTGRPVGRPLPHTRVASLPSQVAYRWANLFIEHVL